MLDVMTKAQDEAPPQQATDETTGETTDRRWSARRTLVFIIVASGLMWGLLIFGILEILKLVSP